MAKEIRKESNREYGVHMGNPNIERGLDFYYSRGILSLGVEVGTKNISDYKEHMSENTPALIFALSEVNNYKKEDSLPRVEDFIAKDVASKEIEFYWNYPDDESIYFEIYRSRKKKGIAQASNRISMTKLHCCRDKKLSPSTNY